MRPFLWDMELLHWATGQRIPHQPGQNFLGIELHLEALLTQIFLPSLLLQVTDLQHGLEAPLPSLAPSHFVLHRCPTTTNLLQVQSCLNICFLAELNKYTTNIRYFPVNYLTLWEILKGIFFVVAVWLWARTLSTSWTLVSSFVQWE